jgi:hypothetical protein
VSRVFLAGAGVAMPILLANETVAAT